ncbi:hypothetical protein D3C81_1972740 [compost metagenome]
MVEGDNHLGVQRFCHTQHIGTGHFVGDTARVLTVGAKCDVDVMLVAVLCIIVGVVRITAVI